MPEVEAPAEPIVTRHDLLVAGLRGLLVVVPLLVAALLAPGPDRPGCIGLAVVAVFSVVPAALAEGRAARRRPKRATELLAAACDVLVVAGPSGAFGVVQGWYCLHALTSGPTAAWSEGVRAELLLLAAVWGFVVAIASGAATLVRFEPTERRDLWLFVVLLGVLLAWPLVVVGLLADLLEAALYWLAPSLRPEAA